MRRIVIGLGAGPGGLDRLRAILAAQISSRIGRDQPPRLPWVPRTEGPGILGRIERWKGADARIVGDVASSYLPYVEAAIAAEPEVRIVCLAQPRERVVEDFRRTIEPAFASRVNHWATEPGPGWTHHPILTRTFPQYETRDRDEGIGRYWDEYADHASVLHQQYPTNFRVFDADALEDEAGVRSALDFVGIPRPEQVLSAASPVADPGKEPKPVPACPPLDPRRCVVLVPHSGSIIPECEAGLRGLVRRGYQVRRVGGYAAIDQCRNQLATDALVDGFEETFWVDSDIGFHPDDVETLRRHGLPIACGLYPKKGLRSLACHVLPGTPRLVFGQGGGLVEILYAGAGFLLVRREVYLKVQRLLDLPSCNEQFGRPMVPYFHPMPRPSDDGPWYLPEDFAFCDRARQVGFKVHADTSIRLWHVGTCRYGWEDAGIERKRYGSFTLDLDRPED